MTVVLRPLLLTEPEAWSGGYARSDHALTAGERGPLRLTVGDLTLSFDLQHRLVGVDAYTNLAGWQASTQPVAGGRPAQLISLAEFDENGVGPTSEMTPQIQFDQPAARLTLTFVEGVSAEAYAVATTCTCELNAKGELVRMTLDGIIVS